MWWGGGGYVRRRAVRVAGGLPVPGAVLGYEPGVVAVLKGQTRVAVVDVDSEGQSQFNFGYIFYGTLLVDAHCGQDEM